LGLPEPTTEKGVPQTGRGKKKTRRAKSESEGGKEGKILTSHENRKGPRIHNLGGSRESASKTNQGGGMTTVNRWLFEKGLDFVSRTAVAPWGGGGWKGARESKK